MNKYTFKYSTYAVSVHATGVEYTRYCFWYPFWSSLSDTSPHFLVSGIWNSFISRRFVVFLRMLSVCDVDYESETGILFISLLIVLFSQASA